MYKLVIEQTDRTPHVSFDHLLLRFEIKGEISPEYAKDFFAPLFSWFDEFYNHLQYADALATVKKDMNLVVHIDYITSSSLKCLYDLFKQTIRLKPYFKSVTVTWLYDPGDDDMKDNGEEFATMLDLGFEIRPAEFPV